ncbi:MAG: NAD(P)/FAD-dependent oxidoreductase [Epulopiscium sp.]|nr:NAD(P)/FAD-dependent oxidoreductase [Candidatus Epulonipiscium sp.]
MKKVLIIGGGPAGMMAAGVASQNGHDVHLFEKNPRLGKKLGITGKGRCNITNQGNLEDFMSQIHGNTKFLYSAFYQWSPQDVVNFFMEYGVETKIERGNRIFPVSDRAYDVIQAMVQFITQAGVHIRCKAEVNDLIIENNQIKGITLCDGHKECGDIVIVATGGLSYPGTGSTGWGHKLARQIGHTVTPCLPSLVPLITKEKWVSELQGLSLKNISIRIQEPDGKVIYEDFGEMLFTHYGVTGPVILSASRHVVPYGKKPLHLWIDLKPSLDFETLDRRVLRDFETFRMKDFRNALHELLPKTLIPVIIQLSKIDPNKKVHLITREERKKLVYLLKAMKLTIVGHRGFDEAIITAGGVAVEEITPKTMESKKIQGLRFAGEIIDLDGYTGGYNLQIAFSTGYAAGSHIS